MSQINSKLPNHQIYKRLSSLPHRVTSILIQLCTNHVSLNAFLKKIKALHSALCKKCHQPETVVHYLKYCKQYTEQCNHLSHKVGKASHSIHQLLGNPRIIPTTLHYIQFTCCFDKYTDIAPPSKWPTSKHSLSMTHSWSLMQLATDHLLQLDPTLIHHWSHIYEGLTLLCLPSQFPYTSVLLICPPLLTLRHPTMPLHPLR